MSSIRERILSYVRTLDYPDSAKNIAQIIKANPNSVRPELSKLVKEGLLVRAFYGHYSTSPGYDQGVVLGPPRVQNLLVVAKGVDVIEPLTVIREFGDDEYSETFIRVSIVFGVKRGRISWRVKAPLGMDVYGLRLCKGLVEEVCASLGFSGMIWIVSNYDLLNDFRGMRLEGVNALTLTDLEGTMMKYYNRREGVRREVSSSRETSLESLIALTQGGLAMFQVVQGVFYVGKKVESLIDAVKYTNRSQVDILQGQRELLKAVYRLVDRMGVSGIAE